MTVFAYAFRLAWIYMPTKKVVVYTRDKDGKTVKIKIEEQFADLLWGDKSEQKRD